MNGIVPIGFTQRLQMPWLDYAAGLLLAGSPRERIKASLTELLQDQLSVDGTEGRGSRDKAVSILLKTWVTVPRHLAPLRDEALEHYRRLSPKERLPLHWGLAMAVYPFFGMVAEQLGRLLRLQGTVAPSQVQRRLRESLGERETVSRATRRTLRTFVDWQVVDDQSKGLYSAASRHRIDEPRLAAWLIEACLRSNGAASAVVDVISQSPMLFPFELPPIAWRDFEAGDRLEVFRQGGNLECIALRHVSLSRPGAL